MTPEHQQSSPSVVELQPVSALFTAPGVGEYFTLIADFLLGNSNRAIALFFQLGYVLGCLLGGQIDQRQGVMGAVRPMNYIH